MTTLPIEQIIAAQQNLNKELAQTTDQKKIIELSREHKRNSVKYDLAIGIKTLIDIIDSNTELLNDPSIEREMRELLEEENTDKRKELEKLQIELLPLLTPADPRDDENILLEIRAGAGGDESALFAAEMFKMYSNFAESLNLKVKIISVSPNELGGYKEIIAEIRGEGAFSWFKYEGGVHRVQRVPATEKQGRVHTSTVSVAIMPLIEQDNEFKIPQDDIDIIITTSSGNGGQSVNTTYSAVRMRHKPTGIEAQSQDERDQQQNRIKALQVLTSRVFNHYEEQRLAEEAAARKEQVGRADRSEKIRTYNFPQDRLTDHRYHQNWNQLPVIISGEIGQVIEEIKKIEAEKVISNLAI